MPHGITQCYLPPDTDDIPALTPSEAGTRLSDPEGCKAELTQLACYTPTWYTRNKVTSLWRYTNMFIVTIIVVVIMISISFKFTDHLC